MPDREKLEQAIAAQEAMRGTIPDGVIDIAIAALQKQLAELQPAEIREQRKQVTVLCACLHGFSSVAERLDAEAAGQIISTVLDTVAPVIGQRGGVIVTFSGDAVMAVFGLLQARESDPENCVYAAIEVQQGLVALNERMAPEWGFRLEMRVGVTTGQVVARNLGGDRDRDVLVLGRAVNLAKQLEAMAWAGAVLISGDTYRHVRGVFAVKEQESLRIVDRDSPVKVYLVQHSKPRAFHLLTRGVAGVETRMVGRDPELLMLQDSFRDSTADAEARIVTVLGDAGVGKSRLLHEFEKWIELLPEDVWYFKARGTLETATTPYGLIRRMFAFRFEIMDSDSAAVVREKFHAGMAPALEPEQADLVGELLGLDFSDSEAVRPHLGSKSLGQIARAHLTAYLRTVAADPTVIFLEDVHWADDSSLDLITQLVSETPDTRLLVVCLARPQLMERRPNWGEGHERHSQISLRPLSRRTSRVLVQEILQKVQGVPSDLRDLIVDGAEGNPFYVEELIKMLIEEGVIVVGEVHWRIEMEHIAHLTIPPTLTGILQARLDSLPPGEKLILQRAAVVGRRFWDAAVASLRSFDGSHLDPVAVCPLLEAIRDRELIYRRERSAFAGSDEYIFKHTLLRDVAYETMLLKLRRHYHGQVARWLEAAAGTRIGEYYGQIASHYELAADGSKAVRFLLLAADQARLAYACPEATAYYRRALPILERQGDYDLAARTLMKLGLTYDLAFDFQQSRLCYEKGFGLWKQADEVRREDLPRAPHPLRLAVDNPTTLDPSMAEDSRSTSIIFELFRGLVEQRLDLEVVPDIARSWEVYEGGRSYIFDLRKDVYWSDGRPVTAGDFEFAWKRVLDPASGMPLASLLDDIKGARDFRLGFVSDPGSVGVRALNDSRLQVDLEGPTGYFLHLLANTITYPVPKHVVEVHGADWASPEKLVSCGPFELEAWQPREQMKLVRSATYTGRFTGNLDCVELLLARLEPDSRLAMYQADELDVVDVTGSEIALVQQRHASEYRRFPQLVTVYVQFDVRRPPFVDERVRQAFVLATDKEALVRATRPDCFPALGGFVPPGMPGHLAATGMAFDFERARRLLTEAGFPGGQGFPTLECCARTDQADIVENLKAQWKAHLGIDLSWTALRWEEILARLNARTPHLLIMGWVADYPDPDNFLRARADQIRQQTGWHSNRYDGLVRRAQRSLAQSDRMRLYEDAERILAEEAPIMPIFHRSVRVLVKPWVLRFPATGMRDYFLKDVIVLHH